MTVIPIKPARDRRSEERALASCRSAPIHGTFRSPTGRTGTMQGVLRLERFLSGPDGGRVEGVFAGELFDGDGTHLGRDSRRQSAITDIWRPEDLDDPSNPSDPIDSNHLIERNDPIRPNVQSGALTRAQRALAPDARATIRPAHVDLMGLVVTVQPVTIPAVCAMGVCNHADSPESQARHTTKCENTTEEGS